MTKDLLDFLCKEIGCYYISDLPKIYKSKALETDIKNIPLNEFSLENWHEAISYITESQETFSSVKEAKAYLIEKTKE
ncbi:MAG: hypothetical protein RR385_01665 [Clostridiales bacterium]